MYSFSYGFCDQIFERKKEIELCPRKWVDIRILVIILFVMKGSQASRGPIVTK